MSQNNSQNGLCKRIIPCLDVANGRTVKGVNFSNLRDVGDPVELAERYQDQGADELMFLDISATVEGRETMIDVVHKLARKMRIPLSVGGGISRLEQVKRLLDAGADKVSINSAAVKHPDLIGEISQACGVQCCILAIDTKWNGSYWDVLTRGGKTNTGMNALEWAQKSVSLGAGEILLTSWDKDGTREGFDLPLTHAFATNLSIPVIASGGANGPQGFVEVFREGAADAALAASIFHEGQWTVRNLKAEIAKEGVWVRQ